MIISMHKIARKFLDFRHRGRHESCRCFHKNSRQKESHQDQFENFDRMLDFHQHRARSSVLIRSPQYLNEKAVAKLFTPFCPIINRHDTVVYKHTIGQNKPYFYYLCILGRGKCQEMLTSLSHRDEDILPVRMRFLKLANDGISDYRRHTNVPNNLSLENINQDALDAALSRSSNVSDQMKCLVDLTALNSAGVAMRFFVASLIEDIFSGILPLTSCVPFGSSVNGFGKADGDLDMALDLDDQFRLEKRPDYHRSELSVVYRSIDDKDRRNTSKKLLEIYAAILSKLVPFCTGVTRVLQARVPIIKFNMSCCRMSCDLSITSLSGIKMAKMFWMCQKLEPQLLPLVFTVRHLAKSVGVTSSAPSASITNFQLLCLTIFFMQSRHRSGQLRNSNNEIILPALELLESLARPIDRYEVVSDVYTVKSRLFSGNNHLNNSLNLGNNSSTSGSQLLLEFFQFYANFNFQKFAICPLTGQQVLRKSADNDDYPFYLVNPMERHLNSASNVNRAQLDRFQKLCETFGFILEKELKDEQLNSNSKSTSRWGLLKLIDSEKSGRYFEDRTDNKNFNKTNYVGQSQFSLEKMFQEVNDEEDGVEELDSEKMNRSVS